MTIARVIGLGQRAAGDDAVGPAIMDQLRGHAPRDVELVDIAEPCALIPLLATAVPVVIVDAVVIDRIPPGSVVELDAHALPARVRSVSTHGVGLAQALAIGCLVAEPGRLAPSVKIVGVTIAAAQTPGFGLSAAVEAAVPRAVEAVLKCVCGARAGNPRCPLE